MKHTLAIVLLWAALLVPAALSRGYWNPDEPRYAAVAREVWKGDGALVPHLNGQVYREKPPLFFWLVAGGQLLTGSTSAPVSRIPSLLATLASALLLMKLVRRTHGEKEGLVAAGIFLSAALVVQMGQWVGIDAFVTFLVTACLYLQQRAFDAERGRWRFHVGIYGLLAAMVLSKGAPVLFAVAGMGGAAWLRGGWRAFLPRHLLWGIPLALLIVAAWGFAAARQAGWDYIWDLTGGQLGRRVVSAESHQRPVWYYFVRFPALFLPWAVLLPAAAVHARRDWRRGGADRASTGRYLLWFVIPFLLFTLISGKRERYILPLYPAAAALTAVAVVRLEVDALRRRLVNFPLLAVLGLTGVVALFLTVGPVFRQKLAGPLLEDLGEGQRREVMLRLALDWPIILAGGGSALLVCLFGIFHERKGKGPQVAPLCAALGFLAIGLSGALPALDRVKSHEYLVREVSRSLARPGDRWVLAGASPGPFCLALDRQDLEVVEGDGLLERVLEVRREDPPPVIVGREKACGPIQALVHPGPWPVRRNVGRKIFVAFR